MNDLVIPDFNDENDSDWYFNLIINEVIQEWGLKQDDNAHNYFAPVHNEASKRFQEKYKINNTDMGLMEQKAEQEGWFDALVYHPYNEICGDLYGDEFNDTTYADYIEWCEVNNSTVLNEPMPISPITAEDEGI